MSGPHLPCPADAGNPAADPLTAALLGRCTFPEAGSALVCGVSGGPDSLALLALAVASGCHVTAVHVDHGLMVRTLDAPCLAGRCIRIATVDAASFLLAAQRAATGTGKRDRNRAHG